jgi:hypothetical protein
VACPLAGPSALGIRQYSSPSPLLYVSSIGNEVALYDLQDIHTRQLFRAGPPSGSEKAASPPSDTTSRDVSDIKQVALPHRNLQGLQTLLPLPSGALLCAGALDHVRLMLNIEHLQACIGRCKTVSSRHNATRLGMFCIQLFNEKQMISVAISNFIAFGHRVGMLDSFGDHTKWYAGSDKCIRYVHPKKSARSYIVCGPLRGRARGAEPQAPEVCYSHHMEGSCSVITEQVVQARPRQNKNSSQVAEERLFRRVQAQSHRDCVTALAVANLPSGPVLLSSSRDGVIKAWR